MKKERPGPEELRKLIGNGKLFEVIEHLRDWDDLGSELRTTVIMIDRQFSATEKDNIKGTISEDAYRVETNKITESKPLSKAKLA